MILKREEKDNLITATYDSSNILASIFDKNTNDLILTFKGGTQYRYGNILPTDYNRFELAESQGKVFNTHIKTYSFEKLETIDPTQIIKEIDTTKEEEKKALIDEKKGIVLQSMHTIIANPEIIRVGVLEILKTQIEELINTLK